MVTDRPDKQPRTQGSAQSGQLPSLTSLRGLAALWVVIYHYTVQCFPNLDATPYTYLIHKGYLAVDLFFILSGFVMTHVYHRAFSDSVTSHYRSFLVARIARIYPLHILMLFLFVATAIAMAGAATTSVHDIPWLGSNSVSAFFANIFMLQGLDASKLSWNYPAWSISVEFMAYLLFPFALPAIWRSSDKLKLALALFLFALLTLLALIAQGDFDQWDGPITLLRCLPEFILGTLLYCAFRSASPDSLLRRNAAALGVVAIIIVCLHVDAPDLLIICLFAALVLTAVLNRGSFSEIANVRPLIWMGDVSYSLYLIHGFVQFVATKLLSRFGIENHADLSIQQSLALMVLMVGICLLAAHRTYFGIEIGCRQYLRNLLDSRQKKRTAPIMHPSSKAIAAQQHGS